MRRFIYLSAVLLLVTLASGDDLTTTASWPMFKHDNFRSASAMGSTSAMPFNEIRMIWKYSTGGAVKASPVAGDLDGDGLLEVVVASTDGRVYAFNSDGGLLWNYSTGGAVYSTPALGELNGDGRLEVVFGSDDGKIYALNSSGALLWAFPTKGRVRSSPLIASLDALPGTEIVVGSMDEKVYCLHADGRKAWEYATGDPVESSPAVMDFDSDGNLEVVVGSTDNILYVLKSPPSVVWSYLTNDDVVETPAVDSSGNIYLPSGKVLYKLQYYRTWQPVDGWTRTLLNALERSKRLTETEAIKVMRLNKTAGKKQIDEMIDKGYISAWPGLPGERELVTKYLPVEVSIGLLWDYNLSAAASSSPSLGHVDRGGEMSVVFGSGNELTALSASGSRTMRYTLSKTLESTPAIGDLNKDGMLDIVFGSGDGTLFVVDYPGKSKWNHNLNCSIESSPALADLGGDGTVEILVGCDGGGVYAFGSWRAVQKKNALASYRNSMKYLGTGNLADAREYALKARAEFAKLGDAPWVIACNKILQNVEGYVLYFNASDAYERGDLLDAKTYVANASFYFTRSNFTDGVRRAKNLENRIDADLYLFEAKYLYGIKDYYNASRYADAARSYYLILGNSSAAAESEKLANLSLISHRAKTLYEDAQQALINGSVKLSKELLAEAMASYGDLNDQQGVEMCNKSLSTVNAYEVYFISLDLLHTGNYGRSIKYAEKSATLFTELGLANETDYARDVISRAGTAIEAQSNLDLALSSLNSSDYDAAFKYSSEAFRLYNYSGVEAGIVNSLAVLNVSRAGVEGSTSGRIRRAVNAYFPLILLAVGLAMALLFLHEYMGRRKAPPEDEESPDKEY